MRVHAEQALDFLFHAGGGHEHGNRWHRKPFHRPVVNMADDGHVAQPEAVHVFFQRAAVAGAVLHRDDLALGGDDGGLDRNARAADHADRVPQGDMHFVKNNGADFAAHIADGAAREAAVLHAHFIGRAGVAVENQHGGGRVDAAVNHVAQLVGKDCAARLGAFIIPHDAVAQTGVPHSVKNILMPSLGKDQHGLVGFHRRDEVPVFTGNIQNFDFLQVDIGVLRIVLQPCEDM